MKRDDRSFEVAVNKVNSILITTAAYITTDATKLAVDNNIDMVFLDAHETLMAGFGIQNWEAPL